MAAWPQPQVAPAAVPAPPQQLFGVVVPGRALLCDWLPTANPATFTTLVTTPASAPELTFFALPATHLPEGSGAVLYWSADGQHWSILGAIHAGKPSGVFRTGWSTRPELVTCHAVQLCVTIESLATIKNLDLIFSDVEDRFAFAHKIAQDLWHYMASFATPTTVLSGNGNGSGAATTQPAIVVPANVFDSWIERFTRKYKMDPNFMMKS